jgi:hypothetical protein
MRTGSQLDLHAFNWGPNLEAHISFRLNINYHQRSFPNKKHMAMVTFVVMNHQTQVRRSGCLRRSKTGQFSLMG